MTTKNFNKKVQMEKGGPQLKRQVLMMRIVNMIFGTFKVLQRRFSSLKTKISKFYLLAIDRLFYLRAPDTLSADSRKHFEFNGGRTTLSKILKSLGYKYREVNMLLQQKLYFSEKTSPISKKLL